MSAAGRDPHALDVDPLEKLRAGSPLRPADDVKNRASPRWPACRSRWGSRQHGDLRLMDASVVRAVSTRVVGRAEVEALLSLPGAGPQRISSSFGIRIRRKDLPRLLGSLRIFPFPAFSAARGSTRSCPASRVQRDGRVNVMIKAVRARSGRTFTRVLRGLAVSPRRAV